MTPHELTTPPTRPTDAEVGRLLLFHQVTVSAAR